MHYYKFHIGDFRGATTHLTNEEDLAYRRLLDWYYDTEQPIPLDTQMVARRLRVDPESVDAVLADFFTKTDDGWRHERCEAELYAYQTKAEANRENGKLGGRPRGSKKTQKNPDGCQSEPSGNPTETQNNPDKSDTNLNHKPQTTNQYLVPNGTRDQQADPVPEPVDRIDYSAITKAFREKLPALPQIRDMTDKRKKAVRSIVKRGGRYASADFFPAFFEFVSKSDFLMGRSDKNPWHGCCFDWLIKPENFQKIIEGNYHPET